MEKVCYVHRKDVQYLHDKSVVKLVYTFPSKMASCPLTCKVDHI